MQAINWLRQRWVQGVKAVLADDQGLGRTATVITFLQCLRCCLCTPACTAAFPPNSHLLYHDAADEDTLVQRILCSTGTQTCCWQQSEAMNQHAFTAALCNCVNQIKHFNASELPMLACYSCFNLHLDISGLAFVCTHRCSTKTCYSARYMLMC